MKEALDGPDQVLVDPAPLSPDHTTWVSFLDISEDGKLVAYGIRRGGEDEVTVKLLDVDSRRNLADELPRGRYDVSIEPSRAGFYYSRFEKAGPRVYHHVIGQPASQDRVVFRPGLRAGEADRRASLRGRPLPPDPCLRGQRRRAHRNLGARPRARDSARPHRQGPSRQVLWRNRGDTLYIHTDWKAPHGRILAIDLRNPARDRWRELIPEGEEPIESFSIAGGMLFVETLRNCSSALAVFSPEGRRVRDIDLAGIGSASAPGGNWSGHEAFFQFNSFHIPESIYRYDTAGGKQSLWWRANVPIDRDQLELKQVWYASKDGTKIPCSCCIARGCAWTARIPSSSPATADSISA